MLMPCHGYMPKMRSDRCLDHSVDEGRILQMDERYPVRNAVSLHNSGNALPDVGWFRQEHTQLNRQLLSSSPPRSSALGDAAGGASHRAQPPSTMTYELCVTIVDHSRIKTQFSCLLRVSAKRISDSAARGTQANQNALPTKPPTLETFPKCRK